jgi:hypothetical protein
MDVGKYCEEVLDYHFPGLSKEDVYGQQKDPMTSDVMRSAEDEYWQRELVKVREFQKNPPIPDYSTRPIFIDFKEDL